MLDPKSRRSVTLDLKRWVFPVALVLVCTIGLGKAQAANLLAGENGDVSFLTPDSNWEFGFTTTSSNGESVSGNGQFLANSTATGSALVVLTEPGTQANSDWLELTYNGAGGFGPESVTVSWNSDSDPGGLPTLPPGISAVYLVETGGVQDVTAALVQSAQLNGFAFPSNITVQAQSDLDPVTEPASLGLLLLGIAGLGLRFGLGSRMPREPKPA